MLEQHTLILRHEAVMNDCTKVQIDEPLVLRHVYDRSYDIGSPILINYMMNSFKEELLRRLSDEKGGSNGSR